MTRLVGWRFLIFVGIIQGLLWFGHWLLYRTVVAFVPGVNRAALAIVIGVLSITFVTASILTFRATGPLVRLYYTFSASWLGLLHFLFMASVAMWVIYVIVRLTGAAVNMQAVFAVVFGVAIIAGAAALINARLIRTTRYTVEVPNLPPQWDGRRAVWVSDIHLGDVNGVGYAGRIARRLDKLNPDIIFFGGDVWDGIDMAPQRAIAPFASLSAPLGKFFITGNHEEFGDRTPFVEAARATGIRPLINENVMVDGIRLTGVTYSDTHNSDEYNSILTRLAADSPGVTILLKHSPGGTEIADRLGMTLQISGHTHRGQIFPFEYITSRIYSGHDYGLTRRGRLQIVTSSGAGTWGPPMRLGTISEIIVIDFRAAQ